MTQLQPVNTTYEPFSLEPEAIAANREFLARQPLVNARRILDIACGTGMLSEMLLEAAPHARLIGGDVDPVQIDLAVDRFTKLGFDVQPWTGFNGQDADASTAPSFVVGDALDLPFAEKTFDCVTMANAIHMVIEKEELLNEVQRVLRVGGVFGFNSSFYAGTFPDGTHRFYEEWLKQASAEIAAINRQRLADGEEPIKRKRRKTHKAFQNKWLSPREWADLLAQHSLAVREFNERIVMLNARCFAAIGAYGGLAEVLLSGYPVEIASRALQTTAEPALHVVGEDAIPRRWLEIWASRVP